MLAILGTAAALAERMASFTEREAVVDTADYLAREPRTRADA